MKSISPEVKEVIQAGRIEGNLFFLPEGQLDRKLYTAVNKVLTNFGGKWNRGKGAHVFTNDPSEALAEALDNGGYVDKKSEMQFFETPAELAERLVSMVRIEEGMKVLEPSAGQGRLIKALPALNLHVDAVELDGANAYILKTTEFENTVVVHDMDFMEYEKGNYDLIIMNPPFTKGQDMEHIRKAYEHLAEDGTLIAISSPAFTFHESKKAVAFREWLDEVNGYAEELPANSFKESGTAVNTMLVMIEK